MDEEPTRGLAAGEVKLYILNPRDKSLDKGVEWIMPYFDVKKYFFFSS